jgi:hypothetical protein
MKEGKVNEIIVTFADYVENFYDENRNTGDVSGIVNDNFDEFIDWAYDEFLIDNEEREILQGNPVPEFRDRIKKEVIQEFLMIVRVREYGVVQD